eukprot:752971-Karenia_brevis.AAC.1
MRGAALWLLSRPWQLSFSVHVDNVTEMASCNRKFVLQFLMDRKSTVSYTHLRAHETLSDL